MTGKGNGSACKKQPARTTSKKDARVLLMSHLQQERVSSVGDLAAMAASHDMGVGC